MDEESTQVQPQPDPRSRDKVTLMVLALVAGALVLCALGYWLTNAFAPSRVLIGKQGEVSIYVKPAQYRGGDVVYMLVHIAPEDAKATAIRELTLKTADGGELVATGRIFEEPPWSDTIWGEAAEIEEEFPVQLPADLRKGLEADLSLNYVEASTTSGGFHNRDIEVDVPLKFPAGERGR